MNKQLINEKLDVILNQVNDIIDHCNNNKDGLYNYVNSQMNAIEHIVLGIDGTFRKEE